MRKWEEKYEKIKNGEFDSRIEELKEQIDNRKANEDTPTQDKKKNKLKDVLSEYEKLTRAKTNLYKIKNVLEFRDKTKKLLEDIKQEINDREVLKTINGDNIKLQEELDKLQEEYDRINVSLKDKSLTPEKKEELNNKKSELKEKIDNNVDKYTENQKRLNQELNKSNKENNKLKKYDNEKLEEMKLKASSRISKCNMIANSLVNGLSWDSIDLKLEKWDSEKKFTNKDKDVKLGNKQIDKNDKPLNNHYDDITSDPEKLKQNEELKIKKEKKESEFDKKHPRLAKIKNLFKKIKDKVIKKEDQKALPGTKEAKTVNEETKASKEINDESFREEIKYIAEYGIKDARKQQLKDNKELNEKLRMLRLQNRIEERINYGDEYAAKSDYRKYDDSGMEPGDD